MTNVTLRTTPGPGDRSVGTTPPDLTASRTAGSGGRTRVTAAARTGDNPATASVAIRQLVTLAQHRRQRRAEHQRARCARLDAASGPSLGILEAVSTMT